MAYHSTCTLSAELASRGGSPIFLPTEFFGGIFVIAGLLTRMVGAAMTFEMAVAILKIQLKNGLVGNGGYEFPLALLTMASALSLDGRCGGRCLRAGPNSTPDREPVRRTAETIRAANDRGRNGRTSTSGWNPKYAAKV